MADKEDKDAELRALQREHEEYVASSCEVERELEAEITRLEESTSRLQEQVRKSADDLDATKASYEASTKELIKLQSIVAELMQANAAFKSDIQRLEQRNDDLERRERELQATIDDFEHQLDASVEQNVFLRQENDDLVARLREERGYIQGGPAAVNPLPFDAQLKYGTDLKAIRSPPMSPKPRRNSFFHNAAKNQCGPNCIVM